MSLLSIRNTPMTIGARHGSAASLVWLAMLLSVALVAMIALAQFDGRLLNGVNIWDKPAKFALSLAVHSITLAWGMQLATQQAQGSRSTRWAIGVFVIAVLFEICWISFKASRGEASHFNTTTPLMNMMYALMGVGSLCLTFVTILLGRKIAQSGNGVMHLATGYGFILSGVLTTLVAGYMASSTGHSVGGDISDASGLGFFHWSTTGGDYRVSHFAALHIAQALPFIASVWPEKRTIAAAALLSTIVVMALFVQAYLGIPFLRA